MDAVLYSKLSLMMFFQFAVWGAWMPVLAARLLGPLKMSGKQTGWIYGTLFLASIVTPLIAGQIVDRWIATQWFLAAAHAAGGVVMLFAARQTRFVPMLGVMGLYSLLFAATIALTNGLMFRHLSDAKMQLLVLVWGPIGWTLAGFALTGWRRASKAENDGRDCQVMAAVLSFVMAGVCLLQPHTPPVGSAGDVWPFLDAISLLKTTDFLVFIILSFVVTSLMQFYFLGTAPFLETIGVRQKDVPAVMTIAQIGQISIMFVLAWFLSRLGFKWSLIVGVLLWALMYGIYAMMKPRWLVVASMALHGLAYAFFVNIGWIYVSKVAPTAIQSSAQSLLVVATFGLGMFVGTQFAGVVMDKCQSDAGFCWRPIYLVPFAVTIVCIIALLILFSGEVPA